MSPAFIPQIGATGLDPDAKHRIELAGPLETLIWPDLCTSCGRSATTRLKVTKVFARGWYLRRRDVGDIRYLLYRSVDLPLCDACVTLHRQLAPPINVARVIASFFRTVHVVPLAIAVLAIARYFAPSTGALQLIAAPAGPAQMSIFAALAVAFALLIRQQTRWRRIPLQTKVTSSFDFSDNLGGVFGAERRVYTMSNDVFAAAFTACNAAREWRP